MKRSTTVRSVQGGIAAMQPACDAIMRESARHLAVMEIDITEVLKAQPELIHCRDWITREGLELIGKADHRLTVKEIGELNMPFLRMR